MSVLGYRACGREDAPSVLFLHGFLGSAEDWETHVRKLSGKYRCISVDLPGHGHSTGLDADAYTPEGALEALEGLIDENELHRPALVGYSMGGRLALAYACRRPENVSALLLEAVSPGLEDEREREVRLGLDHQRARLMRADFERFLTSWLDQPLFSSLKKRRDLVQLLQKKRRKLDAGEVARAAEGLSVGNFTDLWSELSSLKIPVHVIAGAEDPKYDRLGKAIAETVANGSYVVIEGAGHNTHLEQPKRFFEVLETFLNVLEEAAQK